MTDAPADPFVAPVVALDLGPLAVPVRRSLTGVVAVEGAAHGDGQRTEVDTIRV